MNWQVQEAKQRFSELVERACADGPQVVTKHGRPVVVVIDVDRYDSLVGERPDFKAFLRSAPDFVVPARDLPRDVEL